ncbi:YCF48-related protein [Blastopirellula sp. JC732]|uniref:YCF48-related protein n=1 Tax=Blastopirellula sediminis TaxID=2894196 RepID=A0A9X1MLA4_9BACT|nr:YCF48-related protein [Blastopirellula sediminis]MCC9607449.1 YCF48-related protein [Blastopirellula sediminis]MCC9629258.1 YCF48-related protein [Blastopirellula sediminis]
MGNSYRQASGWIATIFLVFTAAPLCAAGNYSGDATLHDVHFQNPQTGLAVGDHGVIWSTNDGGSHWTQTPSGVDVELHAIAFADAEKGWIVGGQISPYSRISRGVVLRTIDGGRNWREIPNLGLPRLHDVAFVDANHGYAVADPSPTYPTGLFETRDGGRSWRSLMVEKPHPWRSLALLPNGGLLLTAADGATAWFDEGVYRESIPADANRRTHQVALDPQGATALVGDSGLVMSSGDRGISWNLRTSELPGGMGRQFDARGVAVNGDRVTVVGSPGSIVLTSLDGGAHWLSATTGHRAPLTAVTFADNMHGWAVGAFGTILATTDGGASWFAQRRGGEQAAVFAAYRNGKRLPCEAFSRLAAADGYLTAVEILGRPETSSPLELQYDDQIRAACLQLGICETDCAASFPLPSDKLGLDGRKIVEIWNKANDGEALKRAEERMVRQLRIWRPQVVLTEYADPRGTDATGYLINQIMLSAVEKAADSNAYPEQLESLRLTPWQVKKVFAALPKGVDGTITIATAQIAPQLAMSFNEHAAAARSLLHEDETPAPAAISFELNRNSLPNEFGDRDFFSGIPLDSGGVSRRAERPLASSNLDELRRLAQRRHNVQRIVSSARLRPNGGAAWLAQLGDLTSDLPGDTGPQTLYQLAMHQNASGHGPLAAEVMTTLIDRFPEHPLSEKAVAWLLVFYGSREVADRFASDDAIPDAAPLAAEIRPTAVTPAAAFLPTNEPSRPGLLPNSQAVSIERNFSRTAAKLAQEYNVKYPHVVARPEVAFTVSRALSSEGSGRSSENLLHRLVGRGENDPWSTCAQSEFVLGRNAGIPPKTIAMCLQVAAPPKLDGRLDDATWQGCEPFELVSPNRGDGSWPAAVFFAYDREYLYFAIRAKHAPGANYTNKPNSARERDADLSKRDHVEMFFDVDRDYASFHKMSVDWCGWTHESSFGDPTWNPQWYVQADDAAGVWTVEGAILLTDLAKTPPTSGDTWSVGLQRIATGCGFQSWTIPAQPDVQPAGFGLLRFQ